MPYVHGYGRVSTDLQVRQNPRDDDSISVQESLCRNYFAAHCAGYIWNDWFPDPDVSASKFFFLRPMGHKLLAALQPGDLIVASSFDRVFRSSTDLAFTLDELKRMDVKIKLLDMLSVDLDAPVGKLVTKIMGACKEYEREETGRKTSAAKKDRHERGIHGSQTKIIGWNRVDGVYVPCPLQRKMALRLMEWKKAGWTRMRIFQHLRQYRIRRPPDGLKWSEHHIQRWIAAAYHGFPCRSMSDFNRRWSVGAEFSVLPWSGRATRPRNPQPRAAASSPQRSILADLAAAVALQGGPSSTDA